MVGADGLLQEKGIQAIGDIMIYVDYDSADGWRNPSISSRRPECCMPLRVPPDTSETGQLWGVPIYRWDTLEQDGFGWWIQQLEHNLNSATSSDRSFQGIVG
jgi:4-alpha-glucanotransferase